MRYLFLAVILGCTFILNGQSRHIPGFVIRNSNDTIKGFINHKSLKSGADICKFKVTKTSPTEAILPLEIKAYGTDSTLFQSRKEYLRKERKIDDSKFYNVIFDGKLDILVGQGNRFYIGTDTSRLIYFLNRKDFLYYLTSDQPELKQHIKDLKFSERRLSDLMMSYHNSLNLNDYKVYLPRYSSSNLDLFLFGGYNFSVLRSPSESGSSMKYSASYSPMFGYGIDYFPPMISAKAGSFSLNLQNRFFKELFQHQSISKYTGVTVYNDLLFEGFVIEVPVGLKFQKRIDNDFKMYIMPGPIWKKYIPIEARVISDVVSYSEVITTITDVNYYCQSTISFFLSAGAERKLSNKNKLFVDLNMDYAGTYNFQRYSLSVSIGYKFLNLKFDE